MWKNFTHVDTTVKSDFNEVILMEELHLNLVGAKLVQFIYRKCYSRKRFNKL